MNHFIELLQFSIFIYSVNVVQWNEDLYEKQLIERTIDACGGFVDIVIDYGSTSRSLHRSLQCLGKGGVVLVSEEVGEKLMPKFSSLAEKREQKIRAVANGTIEQLQELVKLVASNEVNIQSISRSQKSKFIANVIIKLENSHFLILSEMFVLLFIEIRLNHHHIQSSHAMKLKKLSVNYVIQRFPAVLYCNSTTLSKLLFSSS